ncbi:MAG TPA: HAMP domain-containing sensor histidine kinase [Acidobacteriaceae bacterium]|nr:HAMP domain-containing sensor histidine kinase [Acidobacteriaceae bacterium]
MRTKQSFTATQTGNAFAVSRPPGMAASLEAFSEGRPVNLISSGHLVSGGAPGTGPSVTSTSEGLLHDASNLMSALSLYCDLLSVPGVLKPEHRHYADELRLVGQRSGAMIEQLMDRHIRRQQEIAPVRPVPVERRGAYVDGAGLSARAVPLRPLSLRATVERSAGLLTRVAGGRGVSIVYGQAAGMAVRVPQESIERILVNLVLNAAGALERSGRRDPVQVGVGIPPQVSGSLRPWPFRRTQLVVEDRGCGMTACELQRLLEAAPSRGARHGIGFRVVRDLVCASGGELSVSSEPGRGTRVCIEWPAVAPDTDALSGDLLRRPTGPGRSGGGRAVPAPWQDWEQNGSQGLHTVQRAPAENGSAKERWNS